MSQSIQSGLGSRLENSRFLLSIIKTYSKYDPMLDLIKFPIYEDYIDSVSSSMLPYSAAKEAFDLLDNDVKDVFERIVTTVRKIRNAVIELFGRDSGKYADYNELFDLITGDNVSKNSSERKNQADSSEPGSGETPGTDFQSVAQIDRGSRLANFAALIEMLKVEPSYTPTLVEIKIDTLSDLHNEASTKNLSLATAYGTYTTERAKILPMFDGPDGLTVRADRAKAHVRTVYGPQSPELKALTGKVY